MYVLICIIVSANQVIPSDLVSRPLEILLLSKCIYRYVLKKKNKRLDLYSSGNDSLLAVQIRCSRRYKVLEPMPFLKRTIFKYEFSCLLLPATNQYLAPFSKLNSHVIMILAHGDNY